MSDIPVFEMRRAVRVRDSVSRPATRLILLTVASLASVLLISAPNASAHDQSFPIAADRLLILDQGDTRLMEFESSDSVGLPEPVSPVISGSALLIRIEGPNPARTPLINLDADKWTAPNPGEFVYANPDAERPGGVTDIRLTGSVLEIDASGEGFPLVSDGTAEEIWVHFRNEEEWYCVRFDSQSASVFNNAPGYYVAADAGSPGMGACDEPVCGNGEHEIGEECDDGNLVEDDGCDNDCTIGVCSSETFESTFEGIRKVIFEEPAYGCAVCHNAVVPAGGLALVAPGSSEDPNADVYENLLGVDGLGVASAANGTLNRVEISEPGLSVLYLKVLKKRLEGVEPGYDGPEVGSGMPASGQKLSEAHAEAIRVWIRNGAPLDRPVEGTAELLGTCLPPPVPAKTPVPDPPPPGEGFQLHQTPWELGGLLPGSNGEDEVCMATYYDLSGLAPEEATVECPGYLKHRKGCSLETTRACMSDDDCEGAENTCVPVKNASNPEDRCITFNAQTLLQDAQSHHSIIDIYTGSADTTDTGWGDWTYKLEPSDPDYETLNGLPCDPTQVDPALGFNPGCSGAVISGVACGGFGPADMGSFSVLGGGGNQVNLSGSQEPFYEQAYEDGVYSRMPQKGIVIWNSHAFNLTDFNTTMAQYLNIEFALGESERQFVAQGIFDARWIFAQYIPPFETQEICSTYTLAKNAKLFELNSHTHVFGTRFRVWAPPNEACQPGCPTTEETGDPGSSRISGIGGLCNEEEGVPICAGPREDEPMYFSTDYSDPLQLEFKPPIHHPSDDPADRTYLYCSRYDNGSTENSPPVKRHSQSPPTPTVGLGPVIDDFIGPALGGPCFDVTLRCLGGDNEGMLCGADDSVCEPGGGICDACPVHGGVTTMDEMFILLGSYYIDSSPVPEPTSVLAGLAAVATLAGLARRRRAEPRR